MSDDLAPQVVPEEPVEEAPVPQEVPEEIPEAPEAPEELAPLEDVDTAGE